jgi:hypothetical protein
LWHAHCVALLAKWEANRQSKQGAQDMTHVAERPSMESIHRTCRHLQRHWTSSERRQREQIALRRQRQLVEMLRRGV